MNKIKKGVSHLSKTDIIEDIREYLLEQLDLSRRECLDLDTQFEKSAWPYYQAAKLGQQKAYIKLLEHLPEKINE